MAQKANYLSVALRATPTVDVVAAGGIAVVQCPDGTSLAYVDFRVTGESFGWEYDSTRDTVWLVESGGARVQLTRVGDWWRWSVGPTDLRSSAFAPGSTNSRTCWLEVQRGTGGTTTGPFTRYLSDEFTVTFDRQVGLTPLALSGCVAYYDSWDLASSASGSSVTNWDDRSLVDRDLVETTNPPTVQFDDLGQPYISFDGTNDELETTVSDLPGLGSGLAQTVIVLARHKSNSGTDDVLQCGGTNGARLDYDGTNARGVSGADAASTTALAVGAWGIYTITKDGTDVTIQRNLAAEVTTASAGAISPGSLVVGRSTANPTAFAAIDIKKLAVFNSDLNADDTALIVRAWAAEAGISI